MRFFFIFLLVLISTFSKAQENQLRLNNVLIVGQQDELADKYSLELAVLDIMKSNNIKTKSSLNVLKQGEDPVVLSNESMQKTLMEEGIDTYMLISVRGYDKRFNASTNLQPLKDELSAGHLFSVWREGASSVTFSITFYRNNTPVHNELIRIKSTNSKGSVLKKLSKVLDKRINKSWK
jgi:hypothetical protein